MQRIHTACFFVFFLALALFTACESEAPTVAENEPDFQAFHGRFLTDPGFQMAHIVFPLEGIPAGAETEAELNDYKWGKEDWVLHQPFDKGESGFHSEFVHLEPGLIAERITHHNGRYGMLRRWALLGNDWYLIYYAGLNALE
jgi:hypothetical protein